MKGRKFEQSFILDQLLVSVDICCPVSVIRSAKIPYQCNTILCVTFVQKIMQGAVTIEMDGGISEKIPFIVHLSRWSSLGVIVVPNLLIVR